jgi:hypothetical protein
MASVKGNDDDGLSGFRKIREMWHERSRRRYIKLEHRLEKLTRGLHEINSSKQRVRHHKLEEMEKELHEINTEIYLIFCAIFNSHTICPSEENVLEAEIELGL